MAADGTQSCQSASYNFSICSNIPADAEPPAAAAAAAAAVPPPRERRGNPARRLRHLERNLRVRVRPEVLPAAAAPNPRSPRARELVAMMNNAANAVDADAWDPTPAAVPRAYEELLVDLNAARAAVAGFEAEFAAAFQVPPPGVLREVREIRDDLLAADTAVFALEAEIDVAAAAAAPPLPDVAAAAPPLPDVAAAGAARVAAAAAAAAAAADADNAELSAAAVAADAAFAAAFAAQEAALDAMLMAPNAVAAAAPPAAAPPAAAAVLAAGKRCLVCQDLSVLTCTGRGKDNYCTGCFADLVSSVADDRPYKSSIACGYGCDGSFSHDAVIGQLSATGDVQVIVKYTDMIVGHASASGKREGVAESDADWERRLGAEGRLDWRAECLQLLLSTCPRPGCKLVYGGYDGCMSLKCSACAADFCAVCNRLGKDADDSHDHLHVCPFRTDIAHKNERGYFGGVGPTPPTMHRAWKADRLSKWIISKVPVDQRAALLESIAIDCAQAEVVLTDEQRAAMLP